MELYIRRRVIRPTQALTEALSLLPGASKVTLFKNVPSEMISTSTPVTEQRVALQRVGNRGILIWRVG